MSVDHLKTEELGQKQQKLLEVLCFVGRLLVAGLVFRAIIHLEPSTVGLQTGLAEITSFSLNLLDHQSTVKGITVLVGQNAYSITQDCLGWKSLAAFLGLSFASRSLREKTRIILLGILLIMIVNFIRIISTIILTQNGIASFDFIHNITWRWLLTLTVLVSWISVLKSKQIRSKISELGHEIK